MQLKIPKASQELHFGTLPVRVGWGVGKHMVITNAISVQLKLQLPTGTELGNKKLIIKKMIA